MLKIKFVDFYGGIYDYHKSLIWKFLKDNFDFKECEDPDFIFYSVFGYEYLKYNCIKIFFAGENILPNFNECDYALSYEYSEFDGRNLYCPFHHMYNHEMLTNLSKTKQTTIIKEKLFCNFIVSNGEAPYRDKIFNELSKYKKIESYGKHLNNQPNFTTCKDKIEAMANTKFSLCFENSSRKGYRTEKIIDAFYAKTIPIYWGDPCITDEINSRSFINAMDFSNYYELIDFIKLIDSDDKLYLKMINEKTLLKDWNGYSYNGGFETFLNEIFSTKEKMIPDSTWLKNDTKRTFLVSNYIARRNKFKSFKFIDNIYRKLNKEF